MALTVVWEKVAVTEVTAPAKDGEPAKTKEHILKRGETLPDWASEFDRFTLTQIGAVRDGGAVADRVRDAARADTETPPRPVYKQEHAPDLTDPASVSGGPGRAGLSKDAKDAEKQAARDAREAEKAERQAAKANKPKPTDGKQAWEDYAVAACGMDRADAESRGKTDLITEVEKREQGR